MPSLKIEWTEPARFALPCCAHSAVAATGIMAVDGATFSVAADRHTVAYGACRYPDKLVRVAQKYAPDEDDLVLRKDDRRIVFSLADSKVTEISTGRIPEINLVERCS
jgi:hypothetical protein